MIKMRDLLEGYADIRFEKLKKFLKKFPNNAKKWSEATDEVRDIARIFRENLEELQGIVISPLNFRSFETPAEWNTQGKKFILSCWLKMNDETKQQSFERFEEWFR